MGDPITSEEQFWLTVGSELIKSRVTRIETAAEKFVAGVAWFWGAYTASALIGVSLADRTLDNTRLFFAALPSVVLILAYLLALWALSPVYVKFDPRVPAEIEEKEDSRMAKKKSRLLITGIVTVIGAVSVAAAIVAVISAPESGPTTFSSEFSNQTGTTTSVLFSGRVADAKSKSIRVNVIPASTAADPTPDPIRSLTITTSESGDFRGAIAELPLASYTVQAIWTQDERTMAISTDIEAPEPAEAAGATGE